MRGIGTPRRGRLCLALYLLLAAAATAAAQAAEPIRYTVSFGLRFAPPRTSPNAAWPGVNRHRESRLSR